MKNTTLIFALALLLGCQGQTHHHHIDLTSPAQKLQISDIFDGLEVVPIDFTDIGGFGAVKKMDVLDDQVYVLDDEFTKSIQVFDLQGRFIHKIQSFETQNIYDFILDPDRGVLLMYTQGRRIEQYSLSGEYLGTSRLPFTIESFLAINDEQLICYLGYDPMADNGFYNLVVLDKNTFAVQDRLMEYAEEPLLNIGPTKPITSAGGVNFLTIPFDQQIYQFTSGRDLEAKYSFDFKGKFLTPELLNQLEDEYRSKVTHMDGLMAFDDFLFFYYSEEGRPQYRLIDRKNDKVYGVEAGKDFNSFLMSVSLLGYPTYYKGEFISALDMDHMRSLMEHFPEIEEEIRKPFESENYFALVKFKFNKP